MILHEIFRVVSRFPRYISCYIAENLFSLGQCIYPSTYLPYLQSIHPSTYLPISRISIQAPISQSLEYTYSSYLPISRVSTLAPTVPPNLQRTLAPIPQSLEYLSKHLYPNLHSILIAPFSLSLEYLSQHLSPNLLSPYLQSIYPSTYSISLSLEYVS